MKFYVQILAQIGVCKANLFPVIYLFVTFSFFLSFLLF